MFIYVFFIERQFIPGRYIVSCDKGAQSTKEPSTSSKRVKSYPWQTQLDLINIQNVVKENRLRGQIKDSLDWVSIQDTSDGFLWMKPIASISVPKFVK